MSVVNLYDPNKEDFLTKFLSQMSQRSAMSREQDALAQQDEEQRKRGDLESLIRLAMESGDVPSAQNYMGQRFPGSNVDLMAGARAKEEQARLAEEERQNQLSRFTELIGGNVRSASPNGGAQAAMGVLGLPGQAAPVQTTVNNPERAVARMIAEAAMNKDITPEKLKMMRDAAYMTGDQEGQASRIDTKVERSPQEVFTGDISRGNLDVSRGELGLSREKFAEDRRKTATEEYNNLYGPQKVDDKGVDRYDDLVKETQTGLYAKAKETSFQLESSIKSIPSMKGIEGYANLISTIKALDESVVREGEVRAALDSLGVKESVASWLAKGADGNYTPEFKRQLLAIAKRLKDVADKKAGHQRVLFERRADRIGRLDDFKSDMEAADKFASEFTGSGDTATIDSGADAASALGLVPNMKR